MTAMPSRLRIRASNRASCCPADRQASALTLPQFVRARTGVTSLCLFASRRRHTRYWRDWSSDVCSSDLGAPVCVPSWTCVLPSLLVAARSGGDAGGHRGFSHHRFRAAVAFGHLALGFGQELRDRKSVVLGKSVDLGGRRIINKDDISLST